MYQAVDIGEPAQNGVPAQVAFYDDGVGTGSFQPLALLGLAFGIGVARNVKEMYTFLCRNYERGDNIYLFGFSRGAFTVRILAGLILRCGLVQSPSEAELKVLVKLAYAEYKRDVARRATATRPWLLAGRFLGGSSRGHTTDHIEFTGVAQLFPRIRFIGVWDTVDAYGMPVDELKNGIDRYIWPMTLADRDLSLHVDRARQALSLDDERPTFRPVLWSEANPDPERLRQVWFAGVHANVGGGYPDDGLAYVTLQWMMDEAVAAGLRLYPQHRTECDSRVNPHGQQHDSRAGLAGYYRYGPRNVDQLCVDPAHNVTVRFPVIHDSALQRIQRWERGYAPISFPSQPAMALQHPPAALPMGNLEQLFAVIRNANPVALQNQVGPARQQVVLPALVLGNNDRYVVVERPGGPGQTLVPIPALEANDDAAGRAEDMETVRDAVFRRQVAYLSTVALTFVLAVLPVLDGLATVLRARATLWTSFLADVPVWSVATGWVSHKLTLVLRIGVFPGWLSFWVASFARHPTLALVCGGIVAWLFVRKSSQIQDQIFARAEYAWRRV
jgi:uncharacterized protein (DUF2235 family)